MKGHMQDGKFHPHSDYKKGVRKSRGQTTTSQGIRLARTKTLPKLQRVKEQEDGLVKFWAESSDGNTVASLIQSRDFPDEMEIRVTTLDDRFTVRGHKSIMDEMSFNEFLDKVMMHIERGSMTRKAREVKNWKQLSNYDPKFMRFMNRVDKTSAGGIEELIFEPIGEKYVDTGGGYNLHEKNNFDDIIDYSLAHDGQETLDEYKKIFVKHPEIVKEFMKPYKVVASNYEAKIKARKVEGSMKK